MSKISSRDGEDFKRPSLVSDILINRMFSCKSDNNTTNL